jgi:hypothetical protein
VQRPASPDGRGLGAVPGADSSPVGDPPGTSTRAQRRKTAARHNLNGTDWHSQFVKAEVTLKHLLADLARVRTREAVKDADLARLRTDRLLLNERLAAQTRAHLTTSAAFNDLILYVRASDIDIGPVLGEESFFSEISLENEILRKEFFKKVLFS